MTKKLVTISKRDLNKLVAKASEKAAKKAAQTTAKLVAKAIATALAAKKRPATKRRAPAHKIISPIPAPVPANDSAPARALPTFALDIFVETVETRRGVNAGEFLFAKISYWSKAGEKSGVTAMAFGDAYEKLKPFLVEGAAIKVNGLFRAKQNVGSIFTIDDLAA